MLTTDYRVDAEAGIVYGKRGKPVGSLLTTGYIRIGRRTKPQLSAHRLIWESIHGPIPDGLQINHINGVKTDNRISNLELVTRSGNMAHALQTGLVVRAHGEDSHASKLTREQVLFARKNKGRFTQQMMADVFGVTRPAISLAQSGKNWSKTT